MSGVCIAEESLLPLLSLLSRSLSASCLSPRRFIDILYIKKGVSSLKCFLRELLRFYLVGEVINIRDQEFTPVFHSCLVAECYLKC